MIKYLVIIFVFLSFFSTAQTDTLSHKKNIVSISIGEGIPFSDFGSVYNPTTGSTDISKGIGYAKSGSLLNISLRLRLKRSDTWFIFMTGLNSNSLNLNSFETNFENNYFTYGSHTNVPIIIGSSINQEQSENYMDYSLLVGISQNIPFSSKLSLDFRLLIGYLYCQFPHIYFSGINYLVYPSGETGTSAFSENIESTGGGAFAISFGTSLKYSLKRKIFILINADILHSSPNINTSQGIYTTNIWLLNISAGVGYRF